MSDMRRGWLLRGTGAAHNALTLSIRVAHMSPSSSGADAQLSLLEGDCVGLTWPIPQAGLSRARLFLWDRLSGLARARLFHRDLLPRALTRSDVHRTDSALFRTLTGSASPFIIRP